MPDPRARAVCGMSVCCPPYTCVCSLTLALEFVPEITGLRPVHISIRGTDSRIAANVGYQMPAFKWGALHLVLQLLLQTLWSRCQTATPLEIWWRPERHQHCNCETELMLLVEEWSAAQEEQTDDPCHLILCSRTIFVSGQIWAIGRKTKHSV